MCGMTEGGVDVSATYQHHYPTLPKPGCLKRALIVGAGVAGLCTARQLLRLGVQVLVLESSADIGGVWRRNYDGFGAQTPWRCYQFPDFLWPPELQPSQEYPTGQQVQAYVKAYAEHFDLLRHVRLNCKLLRLRWIAATSEWEALFCDSDLEKFYKTRVDFAVICCGLYSQPFIPDYKGAEAFVGLRVHASEFTDMAVAKGRRVVVVGAGKAALDCTTGLLASGCAASVTLLYRQAHWPVPRTVLGVSAGTLLFNRATAAMLPPYYTGGRLAKAMAVAARPLKRLFWKGMETAIKSKFRAAASGMRPSMPLPADLFYGGQILDETADKWLTCDNFKAIKGEITRFARNGVILQDGSVCPADVVLYCTGYSKSYDILDGAMQSRLGLQKDGLYLYRHCLAPGVPHLAFVGSEVHTYTNILTHGLQALWLAHVLSGRLALPSAADMAADIRAQQHWKRQVMPAQRGRGALLMLYGMQYHDQLLSDMGHNPRRKGPINPFAECFGAYTARDYTTVMQRGVSAASTVLPPSPNQSSSHGVLQIRAGALQQQQSLPAKDELLFLSFPGKEGKDPPASSSPKGPLHHQQKERQCAPRKGPGEWTEQEHELGSCRSAAKGPMLREGSAAVPLATTTEGEPGLWEAGRGEAPGAAQATSAAVAVVRNGSSGSTTHSAAYSASHSPALARQQDVVIAGAAVDAAATALGALQLSHGVMLSGGEVAILAQLIQTASMRGLVPCETASSRAAQTSLLPPQPQPQDAAQEVRPPNTALDAASVNGTIQCSGGASRLAVDPAPVPAAAAAGAAVAPAVQRAAESSTWLGPVARAVRPSPAGCVDATCREVLVPRPLIRQPKVDGQPASDCGEACRPPIAGPRCSGLRPHGAARWSRLGGRQGVVVAGGPPDGASAVTGCIAAPARPARQAARCVAGAVSTHPGPSTPAALLTVAETLAIARAAAGGDGGLPGGDCVGQGAAVGERREWSAAPAVEAGTRDGCIAGGVRHDAGGVGRGSPSPSTSTSTSTRSSSA